MAAATTRPSTSGSSEPSRRGTRTSPRSSSPGTTRSSPKGALSEREKALIALGVAHAVQCPYCIDAYTKTCLEKGSDLEQMTEAVHVASAIRGGASLVHGVQMLEHARHAGMAE